MNGTPGVVELTAADFTRAGLDPATDAPLPPCRVQAVRHAFARWLGVGDGGVIVFPFASLPPIPKPRQHHGDGRGRLPPTITREGAGHPVWWLDAHTKWKDPDEDDLAYGVRLALELADRELIVPGDGPVDLLSTRLGWPVRDLETTARVTAYAEGSWDAELCRLELGPRPVTRGRRGDRGRAAREFLAPRLRLLTVLETRMDQARKAALAADMDRVESLAAAVGTLATQVDLAGHDLHQMASHRVDRDQLIAGRRRLAEAVEALDERLADHAEACRRCQPAGHPTPVPSGEAAALLGAIYRCPGEDAGYQALYQRVAMWRADAAARTTRAGDAVGTSTDAQLPPVASDGQADDPLGDLGRVPPLP